VWLECRVIGFRVHGDGDYGKLKQEIEDAYSLVNQTGKAFRDARIEPDYLKARLEELKWAVAALELKKEEQEEQRRIKELIREEEKARRDFEKAMKQAAKEEKLLQDAMAKAREELGGATEEQRQRLEQQLQELQQKLEEAEARNQRAISMAQQTKRGHVYVISNVGSFGEDVVKIGLTRRLEPLDRIRELGDASVPFPFDVHAMIYSEDAPALELELHRVFQDSQMNKVNPRKEFFQTGVHAIRTTLDAMSIEAHWTMKAEAREFRESLAMAKHAAEAVPLAGNM
jgi:vacuolar-type H+-ATPase subunit I/STV1